MYFFSGKLGALERMMTEKPGQHRRDGKKRINTPQKKPHSRKATNNSGGRSGNKNDG
jgi:hypothetical protein